MVQVGHDDRHWPLPVSGQALPCADQTCAIVQAGQLIGARHGLQLGAVLLLPRPDVHISQARTNVEGQHVVEIYLFRVTVQFTNKLT